MKHRSIILQRGNSFTILNNKLSMSTTATSSSTSNIDSTIDSIEQLVEKKSVTGAPSAIDGWIKTLHGNEDLADISSDLEDLKEAISKMDGKKIVELMTSLGEQTTAAASSAKGDDASGVKKLGSALTSAAKTIGKLV